MANWTADLTFTVDTINYTADGWFTEADQWTADTIHFTVDDDTYHTADGWHQDVEVWTADADHFTVDDDTWHTADGWHNDDYLTTEDTGRGGWLVREKVADLDHYRRLRDDDEVIIGVIEEFLKAA